MKNIIKFGLVGFAGYLVGFYECKYKMLNIMWESKIKGMESKKKEEEEAQ